MDEKMKAAFESQFRGKPHAPLSTLREVVEWTLDYLRSQQEPVAFADSDGALIPKAVIPPWSDLYAHPVPLPAAPPNRALMRALDRYQAAKAAYQGSAWQPIETAPKDGTKVLVTWPHEPSHIEVCEVGELGGWFYSYDGDCPKDNPTHWMPLPAAPKPG